MGETWKKSSSLPIIAKEIETVPRPVQHRREDSQARGGRWPVKKSTEFEIDLNIPQINEKMKAYVQSIIKKRVLQQPKYTLDFKKGKKKTMPANREKYIKE